MVDDRRDLLGVTLEGGHNLLLVLVEHHHVLIRSTCEMQPNHRRVSVDDGETTTGWGGWVDGGIVSRHTHR